MARSSPMDDVLSRVWEHLTGRLSGPMHFRFILQPVMATIFAIRDGIHDARLGKSPFFWSLFTDPEHRSENLRAVWRAVWKVVTLALILDLIYQIIEYQWVYPGEAVIIAVIVAVVPYVLLRGPAN